MVAMRRTDNSNLPGKLALRGHFLQKYHSEESCTTDYKPLVLDAAHGQGILWRELCKKYPCRVISLDVKPIYNFKVFIPFKIYWIVTYQYGTFAF